MTDAALPALAPTQDLVVPSRYQLDQMTTQQLRGELARSLTISAQHLAYLAAVWAALEERGEDLSDLRIGLAVYLPQIAAGRLEAEAVLRFAGQPTVLRSMAGLPLDRQRELAKGAPVPVLSINAQGGYETVELPAYTLTAAQARMVFDGDKMRSVPEQRAILEAARVSKARRTRPGPDNRVRFDAEADLVRIGRASATVGEVVAAIAGAPAIDDLSELSASALTKLTESEHRMLKRRAAESGLSLQEFARVVLVKFAIL